MISRRFTFLVTLRIVLILLNVFILALIFGDERLFFNQIILGLILALQVMELVRFVNHTNRELTRFFNAIRHSDFSISFKQAALGSSFKDLQQSMAEIINTYKQVKIEKEAQYHFLQMLVSQLHVGIVAMENKGEVTLINPVAESLLGMQQLRNWKLLEVHNPSVARSIHELGDNGKRLIEINTQSGSRFISVEARTLTMLDRPVKLITLQDINSEIEQKEIEAWHKLIRILTHEIMNSVTPIASLTETMQAMLMNKAGQQRVVTELNDEIISDLRFSLNTVQKRTDGLLHFVENYRKLTKIPKPELQPINVKLFLEGVEKLMSNELRQKNIAFQLSVASDLRVRIDPALIEQVLINLITNSIHALENCEKPAIALDVYRRNKNIVISATDNGNGIPAKELTQIFIPFYSTKKNGSGIGLSLSKQIMALHGGSITVQSQAGIGTTFYLQFTEVN